MTCCARPAEGSTYRCQKHGTDMCDACLKCKDPELYCKFRSACMIHFLERERNRRQPPPPQKPEDEESPEPSD